MPELGILEKGKLVTNTVGNDNLNSGASKTTPPLMMSNNFSKKESFLDPLEHTTFILPRFETVQKVRT